MNLDDELASAAKALSLAVSDQQRQQLLLLLEQLLKWNKAYNLTAIKQPDQALKHHIFDSLSAVPLLIAKGYSSKSLIDVGTGPGFPGLPIAILCPEMTITLLDSNSKKIRFIRQMIHELGLKRVVALHSRVEDHQDQQYDAVISRAFASTSDMLSLTRHLLNKKGRWLAMKGQDDQLDQLTMDFEVACERHPLQVPQLNVSRCLLELTPIETTT